jgi:hypothetical protein
MGFSSTVALGAGAALSGGRLQLVRPQINPSARKG